MRGKHEDRGLRHLLADHASGFETLARVTWRHPDVDDREVGPTRANELDQLGGVAALAHDVEAGTLEQARQTLAEKDVVVRQHHARRACRHVGDYGGNALTPC